MVQVAKPAAAPEVCSRPDPLHRLQCVLLEDPSFAASFRSSTSTEAAATMAAERGIPISMDTLWRNRGRQGLPTWRG